MIKATGISTVIVTALLCLSAYSYTKPKQYRFSYPAYFGNNIVLPGNNPATEQGILLGRMLFYEPALSANNKLSRSSCHQQSLAFTDDKRFSDGFDGVQQPRNTMSLENLLSAQDKCDLLAFLHMLTDSTFITDKRFSNPFNP